MNSDQLNAIKARLQTKLRRLQGDIKAEVARKTDAGMGDELLDQAAQIKSVGYDTTSDAYIINGTPGLSYTALEKLGLSSDEYELGRPLGGRAATFTVGKADLERVLGLEMVNNLSAVDIELPKDWSRGAARKTPRAIGEGRSKTKQTREGAILESLNALFPEYADAGFEVNRRQAVLSGQKTYEIVMPLALSSTDFANAVGIELAKGETLPERPYRIAGFKVVNVGQERLESALNAEHGVTFSEAKRR